LIDPVAAAFAAAADAYERARPDYPAAAVEWLAERLGLRSGRTVLDLGAGTGKLTRQLEATGAAIVAVEPLGEMRAWLEAASPGVLALAGTAEEIPLPDASVDALTVAQAFHWFDRSRALAEMHRVLRPGGAVAVVWNSRDLGDSLQAAIDELVRPLRPRAWRERTLDPRPDFERSGLFSPIEERRFPHEQRLPVDGVLDKVASTSAVAALGEEERAELLGRVRGLLADAAEPIVLRYVTEVYAADRQ
jgi:SAM-dependent methyltransferase